MAEGKSEARAMECLVFNRQVTYLLRVCALILEVRTKKQSYLRLGSRHRELQLRPALRSEDDNLNLVHHIGSRKLGHLNHQAETGYL